MELTILVFLPAAAAAAIMVLPRSMEQNAKWLALTPTVPHLALSVQMFFAFALNALGHHIGVDQDGVHIHQYQICNAHAGDGPSTTQVV